MSRPVWTDAQHELVEFEADLAYEQGYRRGLADAALAMDLAVEAAIGPVELTAKDVVRRLVRVMSRAVDA